MKPKNHPGVYVPPPIIYIAIFLLSFWLQALKPLSQTWLQALWCIILGWIFIAAAALLSSMAIIHFLKTGNTVVTIKAATSLQTSAIYSFSRNPMYLSLLLLYAGLAFLVGNSWSFILIILLILIINGYVIRREESYLSQRFGEAYTAYRKQTRRWI